MDKCGFCLSLKALFSATANKFFTSQRSLQETKSDANIEKTGFWSSVHVNSYNSVTPKIHGILLK